MRNARSVPGTAGATLAVAAMVLSGCQGGGYGGGAAAPAPSPPAVSYAGSGVIEVVATDRQPITDVEIVGPRGPLPSALSVHREDAGGTATAGGGPPHPMSGGMQMLNFLPLLSFGVGYGRYGGGVFTGSGVAFGVPPQAFVPGYYGGSALAGGAPSSGMVRSTARVTLDEPAAYQREWRQSVVRVRFGTDQGASAQEFPAPDPGAGR
ncbi:MAG: hypothetical protein JNL66_08340 [Alphaproteobacteria bacterium]|nr:hypothetical protein [Alphaproteobacteria bacterium]